MEEQRKRSSIFFEARKRQLSAVPLVILLEEGELKRVFESTGASG